MKRQIASLTIALIVLLSVVAFAKADDMYEADFLTGDPRLACEAIMCLSKSGGRPTECNKSIKKYYSIKKRRSSKTRKARKKFLELCPKTSEEEVNLTIQNITNERIEENEAATIAVEEAAEHVPAEIIDPSLFGLSWEPVSENDSNLVVLLGTSYGIPRVNIIDGNGEIIDSGSFVGRAEDSRTTYRFNRPGASYPDPCYLQIGNDVLQINNPSQRQEG